MCNTKLEKQSDPGRIIFIKQTSEAQTNSMQNLRRGNNKYAGSMAEPKWETGVRGQRKDSGGKIMVLVFSGAGN